MPAEKPKESLKSSYTTLLNGVKPVLKYEVAKNRLHTIHLLTTSFVAAYVVTYIIAKATLLSTVEDKVASLQTDKSMYEIKALIRKYEKLAKSHKKLKEDLTAALKEQEITKIIYNNDKIEVVQ